MTLKKKESIFYKTLIKNDSSQICFFFYFTFYFVPLVAFTTSKIITFKSISAKKLKIWMLFDIKTQT